MQRPRRPSLDLKVEIMPLIDVVFLLLTFFVFAMVLTARLEITNIELPTVTAGRSADTAVTAILVGLEADGDVTIDGETAGWDDLIEGIRGRLAAEPGAVLLIAPDKAAAVQDFMRLADLLRAAEITSFQVLRQPESGPGAAPLAPPVGTPGGTGDPVLPPG